MLKDINAVIFDLDGTLVDSMWVWSKIDIDYLAKRNIKVPSDLKSNIEHLSFTETAKYFKDRFNLDDSIDIIINEWTNMAFDEYAHNVKLKPGAREFLVLLKTLGIKIGLATSNSKPLLEASLKANGVYEYFDVITITDEVKRGKNFPDIYLLCADRLGVDPKNCAVFEDILPAVMGAKAAGMKVFGIQDDYSDYQKEEIKNASDHYILKYDELTEVV